MLFFETKVSVFNKSCPLFVFAILINVCVSCNTNKNKSETEEDFTYLNSIISKAVKISELGKYDSAVTFVNLAIEGRNLSVREKFKELSFKAAAYYRIKDAVKANVFTDSMMHLIEGSGKDTYKKEYAIATYTKGDVLMLNKDYTTAFNYYYKAKEIAKLAMDSCTISEYSYRVAMVLFQQERYPEAADQFKEAFRESITCKEDFVSYYRQQEILDNIALSYLSSANTDSALSYSNAALKFIEARVGKYPEKENFNDIAKAVVYGTIGRIYKQRGDYNNAKNFLKQSIVINSKKGNDNEDAQYAQLQLAEVYYIQNNIDSMNTALASSKQSLDSIKNKLAEIEWNRLMSKYSEKVGAIGNAYMYINKYLQLQDSLQKVSNELNSSNVRKQVQLLESQSEVDYLQKENRVKNLLLLLFAFSMVLAVIVVILFISILRITRKNVKTLEGLNEKIRYQKLELEQALQQLEERNKEKDRILKVVAHDLRTPVASTAMLAELIQAESDEDTRTDLLRLIKTSSDSSLKLISEILEATGVDDKKQSPKEEVSVNELLKNTVSLLRFRAAEKQQQILLYLLRNDKTLLISKEKIQRVLSNLITNAIKFSAQETEIEVKATDKGDSIEIMVQDQGIGIPNSMKDQVFNLFTEAKRMGTSGERPFGLGLSICKQIIEEHGGKIWFESEEGYGSAFYIQLPKSNVSREAV